MNTSANSYRLLLRRALFGNACFSATSGLILLLVPSTVGRWLEFPLPGLFQSLGVGLVLFAAELVFQARQDTPHHFRGWIASIADFTWVLASVVLLLLFPGSLPPLGWAIVLGVAAVVLVFGCLQAYALRGLDNLRSEPEGDSQGS